MTYIQKLLALDAAIAACDGLGTVSELCEDIQTKLEPLFEKEYPDFGDFLKAQREAVVALSSNPAVFGANTVIPVDFQPKVGQ